MLGNAFNGSSSRQALRWDLDTGGQGRNSAIGNVVPCMNCKPAIPNGTYPELQAVKAAGGAATTNGTIAAALNDWRRLGRLDLLLNHPASPAASGAFASTPPVVLGVQQVVLKLDDSVGTAADDTLRTTMHSSSNISSDDVRGVTTTLVARAHHIINCLRR